MNTDWFISHVHMVYSPFREMVASLHVLTNPSHHLARKQWAEQTKEQFSKKLTEDFEFFAQITNQWFNFLDLDDYLQIREKQVEEAIERLVQLDDYAFLRFLLGDRYKIVPEKRTKFEQYAFDRTPMIKRKLTDFLYDYHMKFFARELFRVEPWLIKAVHELKKQYTENPVEALDSLHPRFQITDKALAFYKADTYRFQIDQLESLTLYPSTFVAPHLLVGLEVPHLIVYMHVQLPSEERPIDDVPSDLIEILKALADPNRLRLARKLLYHSYCTQQLGDEFGLAKATISKHLKILENANVITSVRQGHYVFYQTDVTRLSMLRVDLDQFFDQPLLQKEES
ncbi:helix-turn-helix transcriptional regulator [Alkalihalobacillus sp. AL-G]|uniref:ArsR/SmtB family transcription factor n=1 Tax=Alkalihalobacillus sp. AL-G TaxID=2926399 RepID=UPI00272BA884|nr:metalloregulator ArsR/SmtB family transcription factor [Alkalihalobacillus sp. AL-G]WLD94662.1 metalloregulator ArsR/SmtB family transcription factor [Alkalihalobacillus sp. AL-G]